MVGYLSQEESETILVENNYGYIGCNDGFNTYIFPTEYIYDGKHIICQSMPELRILVMRENTRVCFQIDTSDRKKNNTVVRVHGHYIELTNARERYNAIKLFVDRMMHIKIEDELPFKKETRKVVYTKRNNIWKPVIYKISIDEIEGSIELNNHTIL
jgi:hypothetical protein